MKNDKSFFQRVCISRTLSQKYYKDGKNHVFSYFSLSITSSASVSLSVSLSLCLFVSQSLSLCLSVTFSVYTFYLRLSVSLCRYISVPQSYLSADVIAKWQIRSLMNRMAVFTELAEMADIAHMTAIA